MTDVAFGFGVPSILPHRVLNSARVKSVVQHFAVAGDPAEAGLNGTEHFAASSGWSLRMLVVVWRSQSECPFQAVSDRAKK